MDKRQNKPDSDSNNLNRFLEAQEHSYRIALREIVNGRKTSCWMWYIFPQLEELGRSYKAKYYGIKNLTEAKAYINDNILGFRLVEICEALLALKSSDAHLVLGSPDDLKLRSSMTLFEVAAPDIPVFGKVLDKFYGGERDRLTIEILNKTTK